MQTRKGVKHLVMFDTAILTDEKQVCLHNIVDRLKGFWLDDDLSNPSVP